MDKPEEPPPADPGHPQASRLTTIVLIVSLVLVVLVAGVLGTVAVLMTRSPDAPLLGGVPPQRLSVPIHFAPVRETKAAPCPGEEAALDETQTTCYLLEDGVTVNAVQEIEPVREKDGTYSVRVAVAPAYKQKLVDLIDEQVADQRQIAVVLVPKTVVAAPIVTQSMDGDSLSIVGFSKEDADALAVRLLGSTASPTGTPATGAATGDPTGDPTGTGAPTGIPTGDPGTGSPTGAPSGPTANPTGGTTGTGTTSTGTTGALNPKYSTCKQARGAGYGPYFKGVHPEYAWYVDVDNNGVACNAADLT
ncbi:excalibur calcium-binding domain-containing protein [Nonomuraea sp. LPB2021202275-12-8]|uniref:excalibur calcium-binding domain-containing protein n=1 Tax=Nonomuraea sp. LPB2021202275-12-8 TaxID=3120159 RepID=UPI00300D0E60